jgi:hypothetical protein
VPQAEEYQRHTLARLLKCFGGPVTLLVVNIANDSPEVSSRLLEESWSALETKLRAVVGEPWTEDAFAVLSRRGRPHGVAALRIRQIVLEEHSILLESVRAGGKLRLEQRLMDEPDLTYWISLANDVEVKGKLGTPPTANARIQRWSPRLERFHAQDALQALLHEVKKETGLARLADADFIIDGGFGVSNRDGYEAVIEPLERTLHELGVGNLMIGGSRKVTEELHLLPVDRQIGQSGVRVHPRVLLAIGISGAPQHLNFIDAPTTIIAFNRDPEAPLLTLNQRQPRPRVFPVLGDLFETVPAFIAALRQEIRPATETVEPIPVAATS